MTDNEAKAYIEGLFDLAEIKVKSEKARSNDPAADRPNIHSYSMKWSEREQYQAEIECLQMENLRLQEEIEQQKGLYELLIKRRLKEREEYGLPWKRAARIARNILFWGLFLWAWCFSFYHLFTHIPETDVRFDEVGVYMDEARETGENT